MNNKRKVTSYIFNGSKLTWMETKNIFSGLSAFDMKNDYTDLQFA